jgi:DnaJ-domain-containing protein 1
MGTKNYYEILGIKRGAKDDDVKQAFRELAKHCHPDRNPDDVEAEQQFKLINTAYEGLKDAERREAYHEWLEFADKREQSKKLQWTRLSVIALLLGVVPAVVLYWVILGAASYNTPPQSPVAVMQTDQTTMNSSTSAGTDQIQTSASVPESPGSSTETVLQIKRSGKQLKGPKGKVSQPQTVAAIPMGTNATTAVDESVGSGSVMQQSLPRTSWAKPSSPADARGKHFTDCVNCPTMTVLLEDIQKNTVQFGFERLPIAVSHHEISVKEWQACVADGGCSQYTRPYSDETGASAVQNISLPKALSYVAWLSQKTGKAYRLVTPPLDESTVNGEKTPVVKVSDNRQCEKKTGWEWLDDKTDSKDNVDDCPPKEVSASNSISDSKGFRVARVLVTWASE